MMGQAPKNISVEGASQLWFRPETAQPDRPLIYRPAALIECSVNFRSLRAGLNHSEERSYASWLPQGELAIDWDSPAVVFEERPHLTSQPEPDIPHMDGNYLLNGTALAQYEEELIDKLIRGERLRVFFNPVFGLFSSPEDELQDFLSRVAEASLGRVEPELRRLRSRFELHLEQIRETHLARGGLSEELSFERFISHKLRLFESENRMAAMFSTLAGAVFGTTEPRVFVEANQAEEVELRADLDRVEQEASEALQALYGEYLSLANEYDVFEIGLQPNNIQVVRRSILWIAVEHVQ